MDNSADPTCSRCAYNLRGLPADSRCPECGLAIAVSLRGDLLRDADPEWLERVRFGLLLRILVILVGVPLMAAARYGVAHGAPPHFMSVISLAATLANLIAFYSITAPEPGKLSAEPALSPRRLFRILAIPGFVSGQITQEPRLFSPAPTIYFVSSLLTLAFIIAYACVLIRLRQLAQRIPSESLKVQMTVIVWTLTSANVLVYVYGLDDVLGSYADTQALFPPIPDVVTGFFMFVIASTNVWMLVLAILLYLAVRRALAASFPMPQPPLP